MIHCSYRQSGMIRLYKHSTPWTGRNVLYSALLGEVRSLLNISTDLSAGRGS